MCAGALLDILLPHTAIGWLVGRIAACNEIESNLSILFIFLFFIFFLLYGRLTDSVCGVA